MGGRILAVFYLGLDEQMHLPTQAPFFFSFLFVLHFKRSQAQFSNSFPVMTQIFFCWELMVQAEVNNQPKLGGDFLVSCIAQFDKNYIQQGAKANLPLPLLVQIMIFRCASISRTYSVGRWAIVSNSGQ